jgi:predicted esterase
MTTGMTRTFAFALAASSAPLRAQDDTAPTLDVVSIQDRPGYVEAVGQIAQGHEREGLAALAAIRERFPEEADVYLLHFNLSCAHARLQEIDAAFAALDQAITRGYAIHPLQMANLERDPDLEPLRADARYAALVARARTRNDELRANWERVIAPFTWLPPTPADPEAAKRPLPLLIVLHPFGVEREAFARTFFLPFCEKHGFALLAPSGEQLVSVGHFAWWAAPGDFVSGFRQDQRRVFEALDALRKRASIDPRRIYITGAGQGAALGFAVALRNPQWSRGAVLFGGGYAPATLADWVERSASFGRRLALVHGESDPLYPIAPLPAFVEGLKGQGIGVELVRGGHEFTPEAITAQLATRIPWIDEIPFEKPGAKAPGQAR